jgi:spermidine synthase
MVLFQREFYEDMFSCLTEDGIVCSQLESIYLHLSIIRKVLGFSKEIYPVVSYYTTKVPTYPSGMIGFAFCSKKYGPHEFSMERAERLADLRYYTPEIHRYAFCLPRFCRDIV